MPDMSGFQLVGRPRKRNIGLPAILITGRRSDDLHHRAEAAGFRCVVAKPFEESSLLESIQGALTAGARVRLGGLRKFDQEHIPEPRATIGELWIWTHDAPPARSPAHRSRPEGQRIRTGANR